MTSVGANDSNAVEVGGIRFKTLVPVPVVTVPPNQPDATTPVRFGVRVTNIQSTPYRFMLPYILPEVWEANGQSLLMDYVHNVLVPPEESHFQVALPNESITFLMDANLKWYRNSLWLSGYSTEGGLWSFHNLKASRYRVRFTYRNESQVRLISCRGRANTFKDLWTGWVSTPFVEFRLSPQ